MAHLTKEFMTAGRAVFTLEVPAYFQEQNKERSVKPHYTYRIYLKKGYGPILPGKYGNTYFVQLLTGSDNTRSYSYLGILNKITGEVRVTGKSCRNENDYAVSLLRRALARVWANEVEVIEKTGFKLHHEGRCARCGRALTTPESCDRGIGPECWSQMNGGRYNTVVEQPALAQESLPYMGLENPLPAQINVGNVSEDDKKILKSGFTFDEQELERAIAESEGAANLE